MADRPSYAELPDGCAWDVLDPQLGSLELLTPERVAAAAQLVRTGKRFALDLVLDQPSPPMFGRQPFRHEVFEIMDNCLDDYLDGFYLQGSTQWDGFGHFAHPEKGFFGGLSAAQVKAGELGIEAWSAEGIAGRGVLIDVARQEPIAGDSGFVVTPDLLDRTAAAQGSEVCAGDVLCVRVGWLSWYRTLDAEQRATLVDPARLGAGTNIPGLGPGPATAEWCWDHGVAAVAVDNPTVEAIPQAGQAVEDMLHTRLLSMLGIPMGEFFDLDALADDCADDGVYEFLFTSAPLGIPGGIGSPPNALAIK